MSKLFCNARFYSMDQEGKSWQGILVDNGKIIKTFTTITQTPAAEIVDLAGAYVYPGFIDTHTHSFEGGFYTLGVDLEDVRNLKETFAKLAEAKPISGKVFAYHFDENLIAEKRFPTAAELDQIFPDIPVLLRRVDGHSSVINTTAMKRIPWKKALPSDYNGHLNRTWNGTASNWFHNDLTEQTILAAYQEAAKVALKNGHTTVHTMIGNGYSDLKHYGLIRNHLQDFPVEFILYPQISDIDKALEVGSPRIGGCLLADGSFGSHTAALTEPYHDRPDSYGVLYRTDLFWKKFISRAHRKNLQIAVHCIGDAAIAQILKFYEEVNQKDPKDLRHEIIHNELASESMLDRMSRISVSAVMQPMFDRLWAGEGCLYQKVLGKERTLHTNRLASVEQRKILLCGGSDWYITAMKALQGIDAAVNLHNPLERISRYNAVRMYTSNAAHLSFDENRLGTLTPGKQADMVCLKEDIFNADNISNIEIKSVIKKGILFQISSN